MLNDEFENLLLHHSALRVHHSFKPLFASSPSHVLSREYTVNPAIVCLSRQRQPN
jgi:hypothetical protein